MKIFISIIVFLLVVGLLFFIYSFNDLEVVKLENGIGSYSIYTEKLYRTDEFHDTVDLPFDKNIFTVRVPVSNSNVYPMDFENVDLYLSGKSISQPTLNLDLKAKFDDLKAGDKIINVSEYYNNFIKIVVPNINVKDVPMNHSYFLDDFYNTFKNEYDVAITTYNANAKMYRVLMGEIPEDDDYLFLENIVLEIKVAKDLIDSSYYLVSIAPISYSYQYRLFDVIDTLSHDINTLENAKPNLDDFEIINSEDYSELDFLESIEYFFQRTVFLISHPIRVIQYWGLWADVVISDLSGGILVSSPTHFDIL